MPARVLLLGVRLRVGAPPAVSAAARRVLRGGQVLAAAGAAGIGHGDRGAVAQGGRGGGLGREALRGGDGGGERRKALNVKDWVTMNIIFLYISNPNLNGTQCRWLRWIWRLYPGSQRRFDFISGHLSGCCFLVRVHGVFAPFTEVSTSGYGLPRAAASESWKPGWYDATRT